MNKLLFTLLIIQFSLSEIISQDCSTPTKWNIVKDIMPGFSKQHDLFFASENVGYTTGVRGTMRKTIDGGKTWEIIQDPEGMGTRALINTLYFVDEQTGFAAGNGDREPFSNTSYDADFLRTFDGGLTWEKNQIDSIRTVIDLKFFDNQHGLAICFANDGTKPIIETHDAGISWNYLETNIIVEGSTFIHAGDRLLAYGEDIINSENVLFEIKENGAINYSLTTPPGISRFYFYDESLGFARTIDKGYKTTDGGITWTEINFPETTIWSIVHFADEDNGIVANTIYVYESGGGETWAVPAGLEIFVTSDGAETWKRHELGELCAIEGRLSHSAKHGEIHFHAGNNNGTYIFDPENIVKESFQDITICPNPISDHLYIYGIDNAVIQAQIFNIAGQKLFDGKAAPSINIIDFSSGYYILKLLTLDQQVNISFIKQ